MITLRQIFAFVLTLNIILVVIHYGSSTNQSDPKLLEDSLINSHVLKTLKKTMKNQNIQGNAVTNNTIKKPLTPQDIQNRLELKNLAKTHRLAKKMAKLAKPFVMPSENMIKTLRKQNPFYILGFYQKLDKKYFNSFPGGKPKYSQPMYGLVKDPTYCDKVDAFNFMNPSNMFEKMNFFTDYAKDESLIREKVMKQIGSDTMPFLTRFMKKKLDRLQIFQQNITINMYFTKRVDLHVYNELGKNFGCATQMYNHIPGHGVLKRKDLVVDSVASYAMRYQEKPQCFNKNMFFPSAYRLYIEEECYDFFKQINSNEFKEKAKIYPIQYIIKFGYGAHRANGVFLFDENERNLITKTYGNNGENCNKIKRSFIAQKYIENPLLLDKNNKFDFRIYMLIASTNPLIVYYHDGFLRVSLKEYDQHSNDRSIHLTNTHLAKKIFKDAQEKNIGGMNETELRDYQMWTMEDLNDYLMLSGKINDPNWLDNQLRPSFMKAFIHTVRMSESSFLKQSNVFEMYGLDFMLDSNLNLWFIECNSSPQLIGTNEYKSEFLRKMLLDMFEIQYKYFRSRMKRILKVLNKLNDILIEDDTQDITHLKNEFEIQFQNRLEPEYQISQSNSFILIIDKNLKGKDAYFGHLNEECVDD